MVSAPRRHWRRPGVGIVSADRDQPGCDGPVRKIEALARDTVLALNHANATGNYAILRDLGAPGFQQVNTHARLADAFAELRGRQLQLR